MASPPPVMQDTDGLRVAHVRPLRVNADSAPVVRLTLTYTVGARHGEPAAGHAGYRRFAGRTCATPTGERGFGSHFQVDVDLYAVGARHGEPAAGHADVDGLRVAHVRPLLVNADSAVVRLTLTYGRPPVGARHGEPAAGYPGNGGLRVAHARPLLCLQRLSVQVKKDTRPRHVTRKTTRRGSPWRARCWLSR